VGPYPWVVKQRVLSRTGHLSNHAVSEYLCDPEGFDARARYLVLAHLSLENNNPDLARLSAEEALNRRPAECAFHGELMIATQDRPLKPLELQPAVKKSRFLATLGMTSFLGISRAA
jgi:hypothetical protein